MERVLNATEARVHFGELLRRVAERDETVVVERGGIPQAVVMSVADYHRLMARSTGGDWREAARAARERVKAELADAPAPPPEELLRQSREDRDEQLDRLR